MRVLQKVTGFVFYQEKRVVNYFLGKLSGGDSTPVVRIKDFEEWVHFWRFNEQIVTYLFVKATRAAARNGEGG